MISKEILQKTSFLSLSKFFFSYSSRSSRKSFPKYYSANTPFLVNPIIEKPLFSKALKALDNLPIPQKISGCIEVINPKNSLMTLLNDLDLESDKTDKTPIFSKKNLAFDSFEESMKFLLENKVLLANNTKDAFIYLQRLYQTILISKPDDIKALLKLEENTTILKDFYIELEKKESITAFAPNAPTFKRGQLREIIEIPQLAPIFIYILNDYFKKNLIDLSQRIIFDYLRKWEDLFKIYIGNKTYVGKITAILQLCYDRLLFDIDKLMFKEKIILCNFMKNVRCIDPGFLDYMTVYCELNFEKLEMNDILLVLVLSSKMSRALPFELLYRMRRTISTNMKKFNGKSLLKIIEIYTRKKLFYFEKFIENVFVELGSEKILGSMSQKEYILVLYHYSNSKYRDDVFFEKIIGLVEKKIDDVMESMYINLLMLSLAHLNYMNYEFFKKFNEKTNLLKIVEKVQNEENLYDDEKEYFKVLLKKLEELFSVKSNINVNQGGIVEIKA